MPFRTTSFALALLLAATAASAAAQGRPGGAPPGGGMGGMRGGMPAGRGNIGLAAPAEPSASHGGLQLGPPMRWWDDKNFARTVGLNATQQRRMDDVFTANRDNLMRLYKSLQHEESQLQKMTRSRVVDENLIFQQIDRVTQARGELEKANAHVLLQIRREMTDEQAARLDQLNESAQ